MSRDIRERLMAKVRHDESGCWLWTGALDGQGYGQIWAPVGKNQPLRAHRVAFEVFRGPIPDGLVIDHLCRVRSCINPAHLEPVTTRENLLRGTGFSAVNGAKTHCVRGHLFDDANTIRAKLGRGCRKCAAIRNSERRARSASKVAALRAAGVEALTARNAHCARGHLYSNETAYISLDGARRCRLCERIRDADRRERRRTKLLATKSQGTPS